MSLPISLLQSLRPSHRKKGKGGSEPLFLLLLLLLLLLRALVVISKNTNISVAYVPLRLRRLRGLEEATEDVWKQSHGGFEALTIYIFFWGQKCLFTSSLFCTPLYIYMCIYIAYGYVEVNIGRPSLMLDVKARFVSALKFMELSNKAKQRRVRFWSIAIGGISVKISFV